MKRDLDLIRSILVAVEQHPPTDQAITFTPGQFLANFPGLTDKTLNGHIELLIERDFLDGEQHQFGWFITRITWDGHDFLADSKVESVWQKAKQVGGSFSFAVFVSILTECATTYAKSLLVT